MVSNYLKCENCLVGSYTDIESGKVDDRPQLLKAIELAKENNAILVIAKLDRLSRNLTFISSLMDNKVRFVCCDMPTANEFTIHIFASLAQQERKMISERTKNALTEKKKQGFKLGKPENLTAEAQKKAVVSIKDKANKNENNLRAFEVIDLMKNNGIGWAQICERLNKKGFRTSEGKAFQIVQVQRIFKRYKQA